MASNSNFPADFATSKKNATDATTNQVAIRNHHERKATPVSETTFPHGMSENVSARITRPSHTNISHAKMVRFDPFQQSDVPDCTNFMMRSGNAFGASALSQVPMQVTNSSGGAKKRPIPALDDSSSLPTVPKRAMPAFSKPLNPKNFASASKYLDAQRQLLEWGGQTLPLYTHKPAEKQQAQKHSMPRQPLHADNTSAAIQNRANFEAKRKMLEQNEIATLLSLYNPNMEHEPASATSPEPRV